MDERDLHAVTAAVRRTRAVGRAIRDRRRVALAGTVVASARWSPCSAQRGLRQDHAGDELGVALAERGQHEVCVVDLDLAFGDVAVALGLLPVRTIADAVPMADLLDEPTLNSLLTTHSPGVKIVGCAARTGLSESIPADLVTRVLGLLKQQFDYGWSTRRPRSRITCSRSSTRPTSWPSSRRWTSPRSRTSS